MRNDFFAITLSEYAANHLKTILSHSENLAITEYLLIESILSKHLPLVTSEVSLSNICRHIDRFIRSRDDNQSVA